MYIDTVTITGADDEVNRSDLYGLSDIYPFVEWGILDHPAKRGKPRYPTTQWMERFDRYAPSFVHRSIHLCGTAASAFCNGDLSAARNASFHSPRYDRLQVNIPMGSGDVKNVADYLIRSNNVIPTIVQLNNMTMPFINELLKRETGDSVQILFDQSRGKGILVDIVEAEIRYWMRTNECGFAGGISPDNVVSVVKKIITPLDGSHMPPHTWIDMETGVRTDDHFDMKKVELVLAKMKQVMEGNFRETG